MRITALSGGVGGARFLRGLLKYLNESATADPVDLTIIGNTGDDITLFGLRVCPDLDTVLYTLGGGVNEDQGWGRAAETFQTQSELHALGVQPQWFGLGDRDLGTHLARSLWLSQGQTLTEVTAALAQRWGLPEQGVSLLPATNTPIETHVVIDDPDTDDPAAVRAVHFQEWWVRHRARPEAHRFTVAGLAQSIPAPGVLEAIRGADLIILPPSNPVVSIGIILGVPGVRDALRGTRAPVVGVSPIIGGSPVRGHADACLRPLGVPVTAAGVAGLYSDFLNGWLVDEADAAQALPPGSHQVQSASMPLLMRDVETASHIAGGAVELGIRLGAKGV